eukprot:PDM70726.1 itsn-1 [Pristionchus pacificus]
MASNAAEITAVEHEGNMVQFNMCAPVNGKITGDAARTVLMKSGLPPPVLGQIWSLSDLDRDGHLDQREFSIAMKLTRNCLAGLPLPPALPPSLLNVPLSGSAPRAPAPLPTMPPMMMGGMGMGMGVMTGAPPMMAPPVRPMGGPPMPGAYPLAGMAMGTPPGGGGTVFPHYATGPRGSISSMGGSMGGSPAKAAPPLPGRPPGAGGATFPGKQLENWTMPQQNKLKYAQQFNGVDKQRAGFLNGPAARNALGQSGLPTHALAHVWTLADVNKDGRLSVEEFSIAMWLIDQHKTGFALPAELPPELAAMTHHGTARSDSPATPSGEAPAQKVSTPKTFEDKRKDNYDRGQAELDRRRQQLQEEEDRRKAEIAKREREAEEKRERERQEQERRREEESEEPMEVKQEEDTAERQAELERQRQMEEERLEQERKRAAERDRIRLEKEKEMKKVMLEKRKRELMAQKSAAAEKTATAEQKKKTLQFQLQALTEKHTDLEGEVGKARQGIEMITKEIEGMRAIRDEKLAAIAEAQKENQAAAVQAEQLAHQLLQLQGANREATDRAQGLDELISRRAAAKQRVEELKRQIDATRERNVQQRANVVTKEDELATGLRPQVREDTVRWMTAIDTSDENNELGLLFGEEKKMDETMPTSVINSLRETAAEIRNGNQQVSDNGVPRLVRSKRMALEISTEPRDVLQRVSDGVLKLREKLLTREKNNKGATNKSVDEFERYFEDEKVIIDADITILDGALVVLSGESKEKARLLLNYEDERRKVDDMTEAFVKAVDGTRFTDVLELRNNFDTLSERLKERDERDANILNGTDFESIEQMTKNARTVRSESNDTRLREVVTVALSDLGLKDMVEVVEEVNELRDKNGQMADLIELIMKEVQVLRMNEIIDSIQMSIIERNELEKKFKELKIHFSTAMDMVDKLTIERNEVAAELNEIKKKDAKAADDEKRAKAAAIFISSSYSGTDVANARKWRSEREISKPIRDGFLMRYEHMGNDAAKQILIESLTGRAAIEYKGLSDDYRKKSIRDCLSWLEERCFGGALFSALDIERSFRAMKPHGRRVDDVCFELESMVARMHPGDTRKQEEVKRLQLTIVYERSAEYRELLKMLKENKQYSEMKSHLQVSEYMGRLNRYQRYDNGGHGSDQWNTRNGNGSRSDFDRFAKECYGCGEMGHPRNRCPNGQGAGDNRDTPQVIENQVNEVNTPQTIPPAGTGNSRRSGENRYGSGNNGNSNRYNAAARRLTAGVETCGGVARRKALKQQTMEAGEDQGKMRGGMPQFFKKSRSVNGIIGGLQMSACLDSGADVSLIDKRRVDLMQDGLQIIPDVQYEICDAQKKTIKTVGTIAVDVNMDIGNPCKVGFSVAESDIDEVLLGTCALEAMGLEMRLKDESRMIRDTVAPAVVKGNERGVPYIDIGGNAVVNSLSRNRRVEFPDENSSYSDNVDVVLRNVVLGRAGNEKRKHGESTEEHVKAQARAVSVDSEAESANCRQVTVVGNPVRPDYQCNECGRRILDFISKNGVSADSKVNDSLTDDGGAKQLRQSLVAFVPSCSRIMKSYGDWRQLECITYEDEEDLKLKIKSMEAANSFPKSIVILLKMEFARKALNEFRSYMEEIVKKTDVAAYIGSDILPMKASEVQVEAVKVNQMWLTQWRLENPMKNLIMISAISAMIWNTYQLVEKLRVEHAAGIARATEKQKELHGRLQRAAAANNAASAATASAAAAPSAMYDAPPGDISFQQQSMQQSWHKSPAKESPISAVPPSSLYDTPPVVPDSSFSNGHHDTSSNGPLPSSSAATVKYRSIYAFESRSTDELSFQPGDVILVFEGHAAEPGWLAGQIKEKVGWFPAAFAEPIAPVNTNVTSILEEPNASSPPSMTSLQSPTRNGHTIVEGVTDSDEPVLCVCAAQFPWKARNTGDLSFGKGDQIEVLEKTDMKWRGRKTVDGTIGWFPKSYVKVTDETPRGYSAGSRQASVVSGGGASSSATPTSGSAHSFPATSASSQSINSVIAVVPGGGGGGMAGGGAGSTTSGEWYVANYDFDAAEPTDLPLRAGDRILVLEKNDDWWKGSANGREGIFPANYVVALEGATHAAAAIAHAQAAAAAAPATPLQKAKVIAAFQAAGENQLSLAMDDVIFVRSKSDAGWWEGELRDAAGGVKIGWFPGDYVQLEPSSSSVSSPIGHTFVAMFDYVASQGDELSFKTGDSITVTAQTDGEWWTGHLVGTSPATAGLFPSNYVQPSPPIPSPRRIDDTVSSLYDAPPPEVLSPTEKKKEDKLANLVKELIETELRYHADLCLIRDLFYRSLQSVLDIATLNAIFINLSELIELSDILSKRLRNESPGTVFSAEIDRLAAFVTFCSQQTAALQTLETVLQRPEVRRVYTVCCQAERARGLSLSYFLLLPLGRVTRYPLLFDKMFASSPRGSQLHSSIDVAMQLLKSLVSEVNLSIRERDNLQMLCWSQQHVKMDGLREKIEFTSSTRSQGPREFLHSGVLYKARSGRMLVAILYNDFLLLTTPDEHIEADGFRVSASTEVSLSLYKTPLLLGKLEVVPVSKEKDDDVSFSLKLGEDLIHLRALNRNARTLWLRQLEEAVSNALIALAEIARKSTVVTDDNPAGRLMVEVMELRDVDSRMAENSLVFRIALGKDKTLFETQQQPDLTQLRFTTQFAFASTQQPLRLEISRKRFFAPDSPIYDDVSLPLTSIVADCAQHRGPQLKMITLKPLYTHAKERKDALKLKLEEVLSNGRCWGHEPDCPFDKSYSAERIVCSLPVAAGKIQNRKVQRDHFFEQADWGYLRGNGRSERNGICTSGDAEKSRLVCSDHLAHCTAENIFFDFSNLHAKRSKRYRDDVIQAGQFSNGFVDPYFKPAWSAFTQNPPVELIALDGKKVCFKKALLPLLARQRYGMYYNMPMTDGCSGSGLMHAFAHHMLHRLRVPQKGPMRDKIRVTILSRSTMHRRIINEKELLARLQSMEGVEAKIVDYNGKVPFLEQLEVTHNSDIFIGMHGSGLTHLLFLPDWAAIFEIYNCEDESCYYDLARLRGVRYKTWSNMTLLTRHGEGRHPHNGSPHAKFTDYSFDVDEFERIVTQLVEYVKRHPQFVDARRKLRRNESGMKEEL